MTRFSLAAYGFLGLPLAMAALPVYVQAPTHYADQLGLPLALTGAVLFAARLVDTVQDPWLGRVIDRLVRAGRVLAWLWLAALLLALAFAALWLPPRLGEMGLALWFGATLALVYTAHSALNIAYLGWGARLAADTAVLTRAAAWREGAALVGVVLASTLPVWLFAQPGGTLILVLLFAAILLLAMTVLTSWAPIWQSARTSAVADWRSVLAQPALRTLLLPYFANAVAVSVPATLALFFINDRLASPQWAGLFLGAYFLAGALGLPLWLRVAKRVGAARAWRLGMLAGIAAFAGAATLGPGDVWPYLLICVVSGLALGADLALPPVLLATRIPAGEQPASYYGLFSLTGKLALAVSGLALVLLSGLGYQPGQTAGLALALTYAALPCGFKLVAWWLAGRLLKEDYR
ncbi:MFS transporter [Chitinibacteraceae bacterium HSL-7]